MKNMKRCFILLISLWLCAACLLCGCAGKEKAEEKKSIRIGVSLYRGDDTFINNIRGELEKLFCYCMGRDVITAQDIEAVCTRQVSSQIFDMIDAVAQKKQKTALDLYYDLLTLKEPPMRILFLITRQFNLLLQVKELKNKGYDANAIGGVKRFMRNNGLPDLSPANM